jgi:SAM-dependent methyltransferase
MRATDQKRLIFYVVLLLVVIGGMVYLDRLRTLPTGPGKALTTEVTAGANESDVEFSPKPFSYESREASRDGTGKVYMGREISKVMGHTGIDWLERAEREGEEAPGRAVRGLKLAPDAVVADVGSGSGYYTFRIAPLVPLGKVIGVDIQPEMVEFLANKTRKLGVENVVSHLGAIDSIGLPADSIDAVILVDAYHEFSHPNEMMQSIVHALRPGGRVYLLEFRGEDPDVPIKPLHKMTQLQAIAEMEKVGLVHRRTDDFLPWQHLMVFEKEKR